ncbi:unnamed protein product, partial [Menidia menidia]
ILCTHPKLPCTARRAPPQQASKPSHQDRQEEEGTSNGKIADSSAGIDINLSWMRNPFANGFCCVHYNRAVLWRTLARLVPSPI